MNIYKKIKLSLILSMAGLIFSFTVNAATIELNLEKNITSVKDDVAILVTINSETQDINTAQATISFPVDLLEVTSIDHADSVFTFWLQEPVYDNKKGSISFVGGSTSGFTGPSLKLMRVAFKVKGSGNGRLSITDAAITASDGTGSNVYNTAKGLDITIPATADFQAVQIQRTIQATTQAKKLPTVSGLSIPFYPDQTKWNNRSASFKATWNISSDTLQAGIALDKNPNFNPVASADALIGSKIFPALADGVSYLHLRLKNNIGWSVTTHYRLAVDATPPNPFKITSTVGLVTIDPQPTINFSSSDITSGINNYIVRLDGAVVTTTSVSSYQFSPLLPGRHQITVVAVDNAGNSTSQTETLEILPITAPVITYVSKNVIVDEGSIIAGGTATINEKIIIQVQNAQKQIVAEQTVPVDDSGNWNVTINKAFGAGEYQVLATAVNINMASSFPTISEIVKIKAKPMLVIGNIDISQTWFFIGLIIILLSSFGAGWLTYHNWLKQLDRRVIIAQRDIMNIFDNIDNDIDELLKNHTSTNNEKLKQTKTKTILINMKNNLEKSRNYVIDNIKDIEK